MTGDQHTDEFDTFLIDAVNQAERESERAIIDLESMVIIQDALARHGALVLFDDDEIQADKKLALYVEYRLGYLREMIWPQFEASGSTEADFEEYLHRQIQAEVGLEMTRQGSIIGAVSRILGKVSDPRASAARPALAEELAVEKKQLLSTLLVQDLVKRDDPWFAMVDEVLPGGSFDPEAEENIPYMMDALRDQQTALEKQPAYDKLVDEMLDIFDEYQREHGEISLFSSFVTELMVCIESQSANTEADTAARIDALLRSYGITGQVVDAVQKIALRFRILETY